MGMGGCAADQGYEGSMAEVYVFQKLTPEDMRESTELLQTWRHRSLPSFHKPSRPSLKSRTTQKRSGC